MRVGGNIRKAIEIMDKIGPCTSATIKPHMNGIHRLNVRQYLLRAVGLQLMTIDRSVSPHVFALAIGWREKLEEKKREPKPVAVKAKYVPTFPALDMAWR